MKRILISLFIAITTVTVANAQVAADVIIKLKSGTELRGDIMEEVPGKSITVRTQEGDLFYYSIKEVAGIKDPNLATKKKAEEEQQKQDKIDAREQKKETLKIKREELMLGNYIGYKGIFEVSAAFDPYYVFSWDDREYGLSASFINGVNLGAHCFIGVGVGIEYHKYVAYNDDGYYPDFLYDSAYIAVPVFLNVRVPFLKNRRVSPYLSLNVGYSIGLTDKIDYGHEYSDFWGGDVGMYKYANSSSMYVEPSFGLDIRIKRKNSIFVAFTVPMYFKNEYPVLLGAKCGFSF